MSSKKNTLQGDFAEFIGSGVLGKPKVSTTPIFVTDDVESLTRAYEKIDDNVSELGLQRKDGLHMKLLFEETLGMMKEMTGAFDAIIWAEKYDGVCLLKLIGNTKMDADKKHDILSVSSSGGNALARGFMGKIKDIIETGVLNYESVAKLEQKYNGVTVNYGGVGMYCDSGLSTNPNAFSGYMWSMADYRKKLDVKADENEGAKAAWDELEKSIVASIANDVIVGVDKNRVQIQMNYYVNQC